MLTPPTAFRTSHPRFATSEDAKTFLEVRALPALLSVMISTRVTFFKGPPVPSWSKYPRFLPARGALTLEGQIQQVGEIRLMRARVFALQEFVAGLASENATSSLAALPSLIAAIPLPLWHAHMLQVSLVLKQRLF